MGYGGFEFLSLFLKDCLVETMLYCTANAQEFILSFVAELLLESVFLSVDPYMRYIFSSF